VNEQPGMRQEPTHSLEQRQDVVETRYEVIETLQEHQEPLTDQELAAATEKDLETVRETLTDLAENRIVEVTYQSNEPSPAAPAEEPDTPPDQMTGRLSAL
jgi:transcription initiation factor IIE alpha subunit